MSQIHATCIAIDDKGVLLCGPSGAGKSDLALRLIDGGGELVADDRVDLHTKEGQLFASAPRNINGLIEVRGLGIVKLPARTDAVVTLIVELTEGENVDRMPDQTTAEIEGIKIQAMKLHPFEASAPAKIRLALTRSLGNPATFFEATD